MAIPRLPDPSNPESIGAAEFDTRRRGFDPMQVRAYLKVLARELARLRERETELQSALDDARTQAPSLAAEFDEERATVLLGEETTRVLSAARGAAADKLARAHEQAREIIDAAQAEAADIRSGAHAAVDNELAAARAEGRAIIAEAKLVRERMLDDLAAKRHTMRAQLEQLRAGRDRLLESYAQIRRSLDDVSGALDDALPNAQMSARRAAERAAAQPVPSAASIEREIDDAARAGMPLVTRDEVEVEADAEVAVDADDEPAGWVNAGARPTASEPSQPDELFGEWDEAETRFFGGATDDAGDAIAEKAAVVDLPDHEIERVVVLVDRVPPPDDDDEVAPGPAIDSPAPETVDAMHVPEPDATPDPAPHEIVLAEVTRSRRDAGLPRDAVPILDPPDAVEVVRVFRDGAAPEPAPHRAEPEADAELDLEEPDLEEPDLEEPDLEAADAEPEVLAEPLPDETLVERVAVVEVVETVVETVIETVVEVVEVVAQPAVRSPRVAEFSPVSHTPTPVADDAQPELEHPATPAQPEAEVAVPPHEEPAPARVTEPDAPAHAAVTEPDAPPVAVDDLFARIRRTREEKVARAEEVLRSALFPSAGEGARASEPEPEPEPVVQPVGSFAIAGDRLGAVHADDAERFAERDRVLAPLQSQIARKIKRLLADEQNDVLDLVRRSHGRVERDDVLPPATDHAGRYVAAIGGELLSAVGAGASFFADGVGAEGADLASLDACVADELVHPLRSLLERALAGEAVEDEVLDRMRTAYREVKSQHVDDAARTIALASFNAGVEAAHAGHLVRWAVDPVNGCSPDCDDNALEGPIEVGTPFPTGATRPPGHASCRCLLVPLHQ